MAQWLRAQVILAEDRGQFPAPIQWFPTIHNSSSSRSDALLLTPEAPSMHMVHINTRGQDTYTLKIFFNNNFKSIIELPSLVEKEEERAVPWLCQS